MSFVHYILHHIMTKHFTLYKVNARSVRSSDFKPEILFYNTSSQWKYPSVHSESWMANGGKRPCPPVIKNRNPMTTEGRYWAICTYLCKTEEETNAADKSQNLPSIFSYYRSTWWTWVAAFHTALYQLEKRNLFQSMFIKSR